MKRFFFILSTFSLLLFASCKVEFSPNATWKEVPVVYCILDQDAPITYVRVQKCYLGEDNLYNYSAIYDSINYPQGVLSVEIRVWNPSDTAERDSRTPVRVMYFRDTLVDKMSGDFAYRDGQPLFYHVNSASDINAQYVYELVIIKNATGKVLASAMTTPIGDFNPTKWLINPSSSMGHNFSFAFGNRCELKWYTDNYQRGRLYQPTVRFFYRYRYFNPDSLRYVDFVAPRVKCTDPNVNMLSTYVEATNYLDRIETALKGDTCTKRFVNFVDVKMNVCNEDLYAYVNSTDENGSINQDRQVYTNIRGGIGIFASRRTGISARVPADSSVVGPRGMHYLLNQHVLNFE